MTARSPSTAESAFHDELDRLTRQALRLFPDDTGPQTRIVTARPGLLALRQYVPSQFEASLYEPVLCLILQGWKEMSFGDRSFRIGAGHCALVSHDLPIISRVRETPYLVLLLKIEIEVLRSLYEDVAELDVDDSGRALEVHRADTQLLDAIRRYLASAQSAVEARVLGPMLLKEIHYRLLAAPFGQMLRGLIRHDSQASAIARALGLLRRDFRSPIGVESLARSVGMSVSAFHKHFKAVTAVSPLQYQKGLRLLEARRMLVEGKATVTGAAFDVGYQSPTQFSREYARKFGRPPSKELERIRG